MAAAVAVNTPHTYGRSLNSIYVENCDRYHCKKNSYLLKTLPTQPDIFTTLKELDLNLNFVGHVGVRAVLQVAKMSPNLEKLCLADNFLNNDSIKELAGSLVHHESLSYLDLSRNPISHVAGKTLSEFSSRNPKLHWIFLKDTLINPALVRIIERKAKQNRLGLRPQDNGKASGRQIAAATTSMGAAADTHMASQSPSYAADGSRLTNYGNMGERREETGHQLRHSIDNQERREEHSPVSQPKPTHALVKPENRRDDVSSQLGRPTSSIPGLTLLRMAAGSDHEHIKLLHAAQTYHPPLYSIKLMLDISTTTPNSTMALLKEAVDSYCQEEPSTSNILTLDDKLREQPLSNENKTLGDDDDVLAMVFKLVQNQPGKYSALEMVYEVAHDIERHPTRRTEVPRVANKNARGYVSGAPGSALAYLLDFASTIPNHEYQRLGILQQAALDCFPETASRATIASRNRPVSANTDAESVIRLLQLEHMFDACCKSIEQGDALDNYIGLGVLCEQIQERYTVSRALPDIIDRKLHGLLQGGNTVASGAPLMSSTSPLAFAPPSARPAVTNKAQPPTAQPPTDRSIRHDSESTVSNQDTTVTLSGLHMLSTVYPAEIPSHIRLLLQANSPQYEIESDLQGLNLIFQCANSQLYKSFGLDVLADATHEAALEDDEWYAMKLVKQLIVKEKEAIEWNGLSVIFGLIDKEELTEQQ